MAIVSQRGKKQDKALDGTIRIEYDNNRIIYTVDGDVVRIDDKDKTSFFDPVTGNEIFRSGKLPDGTYGVAVAKEGVNLPDAY